MFCRRCGAHIPEDSTFCARCGTPIALAGISTTPTVSGESFGRPLPGE